MPSSSDRTGSDGSVSRRQALGILGAAWAATVGRKPGAESRDVAGRLVEPRLDCVVTPALGEGPYFVDERLNRVDIRPDPGTKEASAGIPLRLRLRVSRVTDGSCTPVKGATVDVWQCDALGIYSDVRDMNGLFDTRGRKFLRGYQLTNGGGSAEFLTVYPGWYGGRAVHIHFKSGFPPVAHERTSSRRSSLSTKPSPTSCTLYRPTTRRDSEIRETMGTGSSRGTTPGQR